MAGLFTPGQATTTQTNQPSSASAAMKLFIIQLLMSRLQQTGGAPQTFGDYVQGGPRKFDTSQIAGGLPGLLDALKQPGAFNSSQVQKTQPSSPSTFQDLAGLIPLAALGYQIYHGSGGTSQDKVNDAMSEWIRSQMGGGTAPTAAAMPTSFGGTPQANDLFTSDLFTNAINQSGGNAMDFGASDPSLWESSY
jgi:hypothetical protein